MGETLSRACRGRAVAQIEMGLIQAASCASGHLGMSFGVRIWEESPEGLCSLLQQSTAVGVLGGVDVEDQGRGIDGSSTVRTIPRRARASDIFPESRRGRCGTYFCAIACLSKSAAAV